MKDPEYRKEKRTARAELRKDLEEIADELLHTKAGRRDTAIIVFVGVLAMILLIVFFA